MPKIKFMGQFGGYNAAGSPFSVPITDLIYMDNTIVHNNEIHKRKQFKEISSAPLETVDSNFYEYSILSSTRKILYRDMASLSSSYWLLSGSDLLTRTELSLPVNIAFSKRIDAVNIDGILYLGDGAPPPGLKFIDSTTYSPNDRIFRCGAGTPLLSSAIQQGTGTGGLWDSIGYPAAPNVIEYAMAWTVENTLQSITGNVGGNVAVTLTDNSASIHINRGVTPPLNSITGWKVYRKDNALGATVFSQITVPTYGFDEIPIANTTVTDFGFLTSPTLIGNLDKGGVGINVGYVANYQRHLFISDATGHTLSFSNLEQFEVFPLAQRFLVGSRNEFFTRLVAFDRFLIVAKEHNIYQITGDSSNTFQLHLLFNIGSTSPWATIKHREELYFVNNEGIFRWSGSQPVNIARLIWEDFRTAVNDGHVTDWWAQEEPTSGFIWFGIFGTSNIWVYDTEAGRFVGRIGKTNNGPGMVGFNTGKRKLALSWGSAAGASINSYNEETIIPGTNETSSAVVYSVFFGTKIGTKRFENEDESSKKLYRTFAVYNKHGIVNETFSETIDLRVLKENESIPGTLVSTINIDQDRYIQKNIGRSSRNLSFGLHKATNFDFVNDWVITGIELEFEPIGNW